MSCNTKCYKLTIAGVTASYRLEVRAGGNVWFNTYGKRITDAAVISSLVAQTDTLTKQADAEVLCGDCCDQAPSNTITEVAGSGVVVTENVDPVSGTIDYNLATSPVVHSTVVKGTGTGTVDTGTNPNGSAKYTVNFPIPPACDTPAMLRPVILATPIPLPTLTGVSSGGSLGAGDPEYKITPTVTVTKTQLASFGMRTCDTHLMMNFVLLIRMPPTADNDAGTLARVKLEFNEATILQSGGTTPKEDKTSATYHKYRVIKLKADDTFTFDVRGYITSVTGAMSVQFEIEIIGFCQI